MKYYVIAFLIWLPIFIGIEAITIEAWRFAPREIYQIVVVIQTILLIGALLDLMYWAYRSEVEEILRSF
jgi:NADH:ubiquinone oxidoreductase subunit 3 (subunit A)